MDIAHLREFVEFSRCMNVSEAARRLHVAQPTLSNHIAAMEKTLGCKLISRGKKLRLTSAGRELVNRASEIVDLYDRMGPAVLEAEKRERTLCLSMENSNNSSHMDAMRLTTGFMVSHRDVYLNIEYAPIPSIAAALDAGTDCVVSCMCPLDRELEAGVHFRRMPEFFPNKLYLWMSSSNPLAEKESLQWSDLSGKYPMTTHLPLWWAGCVQTLENHGVQVEVRANSQEGLNVLLAVRPDELVLLEEHTAFSALVSSVPDHVLVPLDEPDAVCGTYLAYYPHRISPGLQTFLDYLDECE